MIELIFLLVLTEEDTLDERYVSQFPAVDREVNVPFLLQTHLNDRDNQHLFPKLCTGPFAACVRVTVRVTVRDCV